MAISSGQRYTCALRYDGSPDCWGLVPQCQMTSRLSATSASNGRRKVSASQPSAAAITTSVPSGQMGRSTAGAWMYHLQRTCASPPSTAAITGPVESARMAPPTAGNLTTRTAGSDRRADMPPSAPRGEPVRFAMTARRSAGRTATGSPSRHRRTTISRPSASATLTSAPSATMALPSAGIRSIMTRQSCWRMSASLPSAVGPGTCAPSGRTAAPSAGRTPTTAERQLRRASVSQTSVAVDTTPADCAMTARWSVGRFLTGSTRHHP